MKKIKNIIRYIFRKPIPLNKIAFYVNEEYMLDHYENIISNLCINSFDLVLDNKFESNPYTDFISRLKSNSWNISYMDDVLYKYKYKVFVSHCYLGGNHIDEDYFFKKLSIVLKKVYLRILPKSKVTLTQQYIQNMLGSLNVSFMYGADIGIDSFYKYDNNYNELYDIFFCHGSRDSEITKKIFNKPIFKMGYPRYDNFFVKNNDQNHLELLKNKYLPSNSKKTILWITTVNEYFSTIETYCHEIKKLSNEYNVIVRPHPLEINPQSPRFNVNVNKIVRSEKFILSDNAHQDMTELYLISDYVFCDYGCSIFSALYMDKRILLLNHHDVKKDKVVSNSTGVEVRSYLPSINKSDVNLSDFLNIDWSNLDERRKEARKFYFGDIDKDSSKLTAKFLTDLFNQ